MPRAYASTVIDAPADLVWARVRDFNALPKWHPDIATSQIEEAKASDQVGCVRNFQLKSGETIRERLLALSDRERFYVYNFETSPFEVENYIATLRVTPVTITNKSFVEWWADFDCEPANSADWIDRFATNVFAVGFDSLGKM